MSARSGGGHELLPYDDRGVGRPLVFLHGLTFSRSTWLPIVDRLVTDFRCITIDLPGHGDSLDPRRDLASVSAAVQQVLDSLDLDGPIVIGHSMGAAIAVHVAATRAVSGLVLVDQSLAVERFAEAVGAALPSLDSGRFTEAFAPFERSIGVDQLREQEQARIRAGRRVDRALVTSYFAAVADVAPKRFQQRVDAAATHVVAPVLAVFGGPTTPDALAPLRGPLEVEHWLGAGHLVHLVEADRFADRVARFAARCFDAVASDDATLDANRSLMVGMVRRCLSAHDLAALSSYTDDARVMASFTSIVSGFPDLECAIEWVSADGDRVTAWLALTGTHLGTWRGYPPTGRRMSARGSLTLRIRNGRVIDFWLAADWIGMYRQLGLALEPATSRDAPAP